LAPGKLGGARRSPPRQHFPQGPIREDLQEFLGNIRRILPVKENRGASTDVGHGTALATENGRSAGEGFNQHVAASFQQGWEDEAFGVPE
jgi:hypothetical protein